MASASISLSFGTLLDGRGECISCTESAESEEEESVGECPRNVNSTCRVKSGGGWGREPANRPGESTSERRPEERERERDLEVRIGPFLYVDVVVSTVTLGLCSRSWIFSRPKASSWGVWLLVTLAAFRVAASGDESSMSNWSSSSSETSSSSSSSIVSSTGSAVDVFARCSEGPVLELIPRLLRFLGLAGPSSTTTNDFCLSRSFHLRVREMAWNQSVDCLSAQTVGKGYFEAVTLM